jgi:fluoroquinolone transport system permease protein
MIRKIIINSLKADIKFILRDPMLLFAMLAPIMVIIFLRLVFPQISMFILLKTGFQLDRYYSLVAITMVPIIPMLFGLVYAFILLDESDSHILQVISVTPAGKKNFLYMRMLVPAFLGFIMVLVSIFLTNPVPSEGWLRTLFIAFILSIQSSFVFLFIGSLAGNKVEGLALSKFYGIFFIALPAGLLLHHPWNYFAFFSPLYWSGCAWVCSNPVESLIYGAISVFISIGCILIFFRHFLQKHSN